MLFHSTCNANMILQTLRQTAHYTTKLESLSLSSPKPITSSSSSALLLPNAIAMSSFCAFNLMAFDVPNCRSTFSIEIFASLASPTSITWAMNAALLLSLFLLLHFLFLCSGTMALLSIVALTPVPVYDQLPGSHCYPL